MTNKKELGWDFGPGMRPNRLADSLLYILFAFLFFPYCTSWDCPKNHERTTQITIRENQEWNYRNQEKIRIK